MKRTLACLLLLLSLASTFAGCKRHKVALRQTEEQPETRGGVASAIRMGDPRAAGQLLTGFHDIEAHAWRWTMRQFAVTLRPPPGAAQKGAVLVLTLTVPQAIIEAEKSIALSVSVGGSKLAGESWSAPGTYVYQQTVPASLLAGDSVRVDFELDKALPPTERDARELGIVVSKVGLELK